MPARALAGYPRNMRILCAVLVCAACGGAVDDLSSNADDMAVEAEDLLPGPGLLRSSYAFTIGAGRHKSNRDFIAKPHIGKRVDRSLRFRATFSADAAYTTSNPANQSDWNKLMGITTDRIHKNSIRIGWRWNPQSQKVELGFYGYLDGARFMPMLTDVAPGQSIDCELRMTNTSITARAGSVTRTETGSLGASFPTTWVLHSAYFGGDETAPHDIHITVDNVSAD